MGKKYQIGIGKSSWFWESNIVNDQVTLPLRLEETKDHCFKTNKRIFSLESLDEHINPPHKIDCINFFTEEQAKDILKKLKTLFPEE